MSDLRVIIGDSRTATAGRRQQDGDSRTALQWPRKHAPSIPLPYAAPVACSMLQTVRAMHGYAIAAAIRDMANPRYRRAAWPVYEPDRKCDEPSRKSSVD